MRQELVFFTNPQSRASIVHWLLEEIGRPYTIKTLDYGTSMKSPEYLAINPMGKVPAIKHGDQVVTEAAAICAYLADAFPEAKLAPAPEHRGAYYRWLFFAAACLEPAYGNHALGWDPPPDKEGQVGYGSYQRVMNTLATALKDRTYIAGDHFTAADLYLVSHLNWGLMWNLIEKRPEFEAYRDTHINRPARKRAEQAAQKLIAQKAGQKA